MALSRDDLQFTAFGELLIGPLTLVGGWKFSANINSEIVTTSVSNGTVTHDDGHAKLSTGAGINQWAKMQTNRALRYMPGMGGVVRFTARFTPGVAGSRQLIGVGDIDQDGFYFGYNGADFGILRQRDGVDYWDNNVVIKPSNQELIDQTKGNVYQIRYQWLGYGAIQFGVENPRSGKIEHQHLISYANQYTETSILDPTLPLVVYVENTTNDTDIVVRTPSGAMFVEGFINDPPPLNPFTLYHAFDNSKSGITTETNVVTVRNNTTFSGATNRARARLIDLTVATDGTKNATIRIKVNATLGGTPSYVDYNSNTSILAKDVAGTTVTGGTQRYTLALAKVDSLDINLSHLGIELGPGDTVTISATSSGATEVLVGATFAELL